MSGIARIRLTDFIPYYFKYAYRAITKKTHTHFWFPGGRGSLKSTVVSELIVLGIMREPGTHAVVFRQIKDTCRKSVYEQVIWSIKQLKVEHLWNFSEKPNCTMVCTYTPTGQKIFFGGMEGDNTKGFKVSDGYIKWIWYEEVDQFKGMNEIRKANQSFMRGADDFCVFYSYNPPKSKRSWVNGEIDKQKHRDDTMVVRSNYTMLSEKQQTEWLGKQFLIEAEELKRINERAYNHEYLGEAIGEGGEIFDNVKEMIMSDEFIQELDYSTHREGLDWGFAVDPFDWGRGSYDRKRKILYLFDEIHEIGLTNDVAAEKIKEKRWNYLEDAQDMSVVNYNFRCAADSAEPKSVQEVRGYGLGGVFAAKKGPGSIETGIKFLQSLTAIYIDPVRCPKTYEEFTGYEFERTKDGEFISRYPDKNNHAIDRTRYMLSEDIVQRRRSSGVI